MLDQVIISHAKIAGIVRIFLSLKKDDSTRFCMDYHKVNDVTWKDA